MYKIVTLPAAVVVEPTVVAAVVAYSADFVVAVVAAVASAFFAVATVAFALDFVVS
mgnify:CR=1 FL=1